MGFTAKTSSDDVIKTANLSKMSKDKFEILTKSTLCELLVHYIHESETNHDQLISKINSNMSLTFDSKLNTISSMYNSKLKKLEDTFQEEIGKLKSYVPDIKQEVDTGVTPEHTTKYSLLVKKPAQSNKSWSSIAEDLATELHDIPIMKSSVTKDDKAFHVAFGKEEDRDKAMELLDGQDLELEAASKTQAKLSPKMKILDLNFDKYARDGEDNEVSKERLYKAILAKMKLFDLWFKIKR